MKMVTERLLIRDLEPRDAEPLASLWSDSEVTRYSGGPRDREKVVGLVLQELQEPRPKRLDRWTVLERATGRFLGECGFLSKDVDGIQEVELIYYLVRDAWNNGFATEAARAILTHGFADLGLERIIALIDPLNIASERVAVKLGFRLERDILRNGHTKRLYSAIRS